jgi:hypothetical protein
MDFRTDAHRFMGNDTVVNPKIAPDLLTDFFTITGSVDLNSDKKNAAVSFLSDSYPNSFPNMKTSPVTEAKINSIINSFKYTNSSGYDEFPPSLPQGQQPLVGHGLLIIKAS